MGLFSRKSTVYVSSVVYNMAGDVAKRPNYLKTVVIGAMLGEQRSMGEAVVSSYLNGPGLNLRRYGDWAQSSGYTSGIGQISGAIQAGSSLDSGGVAGAIPDEGKTVFIQSVKLGAADYEFWTDQHILDYYPELIVANYTGDYDGNTGLISIATESTPIVFAPVGYDPTARYIYAAYTLGEDETEDAPVLGSVITLSTNQSFPSTVGYTNQYTNNTPSTIPLRTVTTTTVTYSDSRPQEQSVSDVTVQHAFTAVEAQWSKLTYQGAMKSRRDISTRWSVGSKTPTTTNSSSNETIAGGVIKTTTVHKVEDVFSLVRSHREDTQEVRNSSVSNLKLFIYKYGSGNAVLDAMFNTDADAGSFLPYIPVRINNKFVSGTDYPATYAWAKKAYKKAVKAKFDDFVETVADNSSIGDIDYAYVAFGVSLNVKEMACRKYLFKFFEAVAQDPNLTTSADYDAWQASWEIAHASMQVWITWREAQYNSESAMYNTPAPLRQSYPSLPSNSLRVSSTSSSSMNYDMSVVWSYIDQSEGFGLAKPTASTGQVWLEISTPVTFTEIAWYERNDERGVVQTQKESIDVVTITWQIGPNNWKRITVGGLHHRNLIYGGKSVIISAKEALEDSEESGFIIPLHDEIYRSVGVKDGTQMATACVFAVFNCYKVVKQKWYQTSLFQIVLIVAVIIITVMYPPAGATIIGTTLGLSGTAALLVGVAVNALAGMILMRIIQAGVSKLFGDKYAAIITAVIAVVAMQVGGAMIAGQSMAAGFSSLMNPASLLKLTLAAGNGYAEYLQGETFKYATATAEAQKAYKVESNSIMDKYLTEFGLGKTIIDPLGFTDAIGSDYTYEASESFISRTLMTGSEISALSVGLITDFVNMTTNTALL